MLPLILEKYGMTEEKCMGTFAELFEYGDKGIPEEKIQEFEQKVEKVFQNGGMMDVEILQLFGKKVATIHKAKMNSKGMNFTYNYYEDDAWENAGYSRKSKSVWSNKIGWSQYNWAVVAAYTLEEQYNENVVATMVNGELVDTWSCVGWLNYLFDEEKHVKNFDAWKLFEAINYSEHEYHIWIDWGRWDGFGDKRYAFISGCEIHSVMCGVDEALKKFKPLAKGRLEKLVWDAMKNTNELLRLSVEKKLNSNKCYCEEMMQCIKQFYLKEDMEEVKKLFDGKYESLIIGLNVTDAPAFVVKVISEIFEKDFKELWDGVKEVVYRKQELLYGNECYCIIPISTAEFFKQSPDDMIYYWEDDDKITFSDELWEWFGTLRKEYERLSEEDVTIESLLHYMVELLDEADENYYNIFAFTEFVEECMERLRDKRYQVLWRLFDNMIHNEELKKAGDVVFVPDGPGHENEGIHYWGEQPKRRLISSWSIMDPSKKKNKARVTLRRYLALVANRKLREKVFGF